MKRLLLCVVLVTAACGGDKVTAPLPCDTYTGGLLSGNTGTLPGTYTLTSLCQGTKPDLRPPDATGTVTLDATNFTASLIIQGAPITFSGGLTPYPTHRATINLVKPLPTPSAR